MQSINVILNNQFFSFIILTINLKQSINVNIYLFIVENFDMDLVIFLNLSILIIWFYEMQEWI